MASSSILARFPLYFGAFLVTFSLQSGLSQSNERNSNVEKRPRKAVVDPSSVHELHQVPSHFRYSGEYVLHQRTKTSALEQIETPTAALRYHVFTDGNEVRIYLATTPKDYSSFQVYRSDGVQILKNEGQTQELVPGVQAKSMTGDKLRHLCLAQDFFQLTEFPGNSDQLILLRAQRVGRPNQQIRKQ